MLGLAGAADRSNPAKRRIGDAGRPGVAGRARCTTRRCRCLRPSGASGGSRSSAPLGGRVSLRLAMTMDLHRARRFIEAVPDGSWTTYKDVATAAGNSNGAMAIGTWLRNSGGAIKNYWRVLNVKGVVPDAFVGGGSGPLDAVAARDLLRREGVGVDADGRVRQRQRFTYEDWIRLQRDRGGGVVPAAKPPAHLQPTTPETTSEPRISGTLTVRHHRSGKAIADLGAVRTVPDAIICADWSKYPGKRQAWIADPRELRLRPLRASSLTVRTLVEAAECTLREGFVLVAFDAPIGVPASYLDAARPILNMEARTTFVDWLPIALARAGFCDPCAIPTTGPPRGRSFRSRRAREAARCLSWLLRPTASTYGAGSRRKPAATRSSRSACRAKWPQRHRRCGGN